MENGVTVALEPQLDACIEMQAKREYNRTLAGMMNGDDSTLAGKLETLRLFLEQENFNRLRAESEPYLVKGKHVTFLVKLRNGRPAHEM